MRQAAVAFAVLTALAPATGSAADDPSGEPILRLVSPGRAPLKVLRYRAKAGQKAHASMTMSMAMAMEMAGRAMPMPAVPEMRCGFDVTVTEVTPQGDIHYDFVFSDFDAVAAAEVPAAVLEGTRRAVAGLRGMRGRAVVSNRGITREARLEVPPEAPAQLKQTLDSLQQSMRQLSAPLPEEPVGPGARWDTTHRLTQNGITIEQTGHVELTSLEKERIQLAIALTQSAPPQRMALAGVPPAMRTDLVSLQSAGEGVTVLDLGLLLPSSARMKLKMQMAMRMQAGEDKPQNMAMTMDMTMALTGR